jgi:1-acyl-sn-glycerol-3-phosphate acyltransferase
LHQRQLININFTQVKFISKILLRLFGWKLQQGVPKHIKKCVIIQAPHTSNWDFVIGKLAGYVFDVHPKIFIKKSVFFFPLGWMLKKMGGMPVDREKRNNIVEEIAYEMVVNDEFMVLLTPEGTRKYSPNWRRGFYYIAKAAQVPVIPVYICYEKKEIGFADPFPLSDNVENDIEKLKQFYRQFKGKHPHMGVK